MDIIVAGLILMFLITWASRRFAPLLQGRHSARCVWREGTREVSWGAGEAARHCAVRTLQIDLGRRLASDFQKETCRVESAGTRAKAGFR